jgi:hypothetical protein
MSNNYSFPRHDGDGSLEFKESLAQTLAGSASLWDVHCKKEQKGSIE